MQGQGFSIEEVWSCLTQARIDWSDHSLDRLEERGIKRGELIGLLYNSEIIEARFDAFPLTKCLLLGYTVKDESLYASVGYNKKRERIVIITVHWQEPSKWVSDTYAFRGRVSRD